MAPHVNKCIVASDLHAIVRLVSRAFYATKRLRFARVARAKMAQHVQKIGLPAFSAIVRQALQASIVAFKLTCVNRYHAKMERNVINLSTIIHVLACPDSLEPIATRN